MSDQPVRSDEVLRPAAEPSRARILLAGDADTREHVRRLLADLYDVDAVADGQEALDAVRRQVPDLVLADAVMPRLDGFGLLRELRGQGATRAVPVVLLTSVPGEEARIDGTAPGTVSRLVKPVSAREVLAVVSARIEIARARRETEEVRRGLSETEALKAANRMLRDSRRAALNLMEDAIAARGQAEQARAALQESEERLRFALETGRTGAWDLDLVDHAAYRSLEHDRIFGIDPLSQWTYERFIAHVVPEDRAAVEAQFHHAIETRGDWSFECRIRREDGEICWIWAAGRHRAIGGQDLRRMAGIVQDITDRKRAEAALQESEARFRLMADAMPQLAWMGRPDGYLYWYNQRWYQYTGTTPEQMEGWGWQSVHDPVELPGVLERWRASIATGEPFEMAFPLRGADGVFRLFLTRGFPLKDAAGRVTQWFGTNTDVTELKRAEEAVRTALQRFYSVIANMYAGILLVSDDDKVEFANRAFCELFELEESPASLSGLHSSAIMEKIGPAYLHPEEELARIREIVGWGRPLQGEEILMRNGRTYLRDYIPIQIDGKSYGRLWHHLEITGRKRAEDVLRESEERYRTLFNSLMEGYCVVEMIYDADGKPVDYRFLEVNPAFEAQSGLHDAPGRTMRELSPGHEAHWFEVFGRVARTGEPARFVSEARDLDRWFDVYAFRLGGQDSRRVAICFNNATARKRYEQELESARESLQREKDILQSVMNGARNSHLVYLDRNFDFVRVNETYAGSCGFTPEQMVGKNHFALYPDAENEAIFARVRDTGIAAEHHDKPFVFPDQPLRGVTYWDWTLHPVLGDGDEVSGLIFSLVETTERVLAERALRESEERYRALVEMAPEAVFVHQGGRYVYANPAGLRLFGAQEPDQLVGREVLELVHPADRERVGARMGAVAGGGAAVPSEVRILRLDGVEVLAESTASHVVFHGHPAGQVIIRDIGERRRLEQHLAHSQKMEALGVLAGGVAHDFNNMLVGVIGNASLAQDMLPVMSPVQPYLERIVKVGEYAAGLTRQLLAYAGKGRVVLESADLPGLARESLELLRSSIPNRVTVNLELTEPLPAVRADRAQLQQVIMNLAVNAAEAIGAAPGVITVRTRLSEPADEVHAEGLAAAALRGRQVVLEVSDTGCGMDEETRARIFEPFFTTKFLGRGLGLAAVGGIVRDHGGIIRVSSVPGEGSRFTVFLPATEGAGAAAAEASPGATAGASGPGGVVLLVDDEEVVREMGKIALERQGFEVLLADSGRAAIELFGRESARVGLVILDLSMPGMGGADVLPQLLEIRRDVRVVLSSGFSEDEVRKRLPESPARPFIQKPYTAARLAEAVRLALR